MYVCICNAIRQSELRTEARNCDYGAEAIYRALGRPPQCRQCIDDAEHIIEDERRAHRLPACIA